jgi:hypothetical protein
MTVRAAIDAARQRNAQAYTDISFADSPHQMQLRFTDYTYNAATASSIEGTNGSVTLPLPESLADAIGVNIGGTELGGLGVLAAQGSGAIRGAIDSILQERDAVSEIRSLIEGGAQSATDLSTIGSATSYFTRRALSQIGFEGVAQGISVGSGTALNPHKALIFDGVELKTFNFSWNLSPRSQEEADTIASIINTIRVNMLPEFEGGPARPLLRYPSLVQPVIHGISQQHTFAFKVGMISNLSVDYSPNGMAINRGGIPAITKLSFTFNEASIPTREQYGGGQGG